MPHSFLKYALSLVLLLSLQLSHGQSGEIAQPLEKNVINGNLLGTSSLIGLSFERFVSAHTTIEFGLGLIGIGAGFSYYLAEPQENKVCIYLGAKVSTGVLVDVGGGYVGYLPIGLNYFSKFGVNLGVDVGPAYGVLHESDFDGQMGSTRVLPLYGNLRLGYRFSD